VEYPKKAEPIGEQVAQDIRDTVSRIRLDVEKEGIAAIRRYSEQLDGWNPESFVVGEEETDHLWEALRGTPLRPLGLSPRPPHWSREAFVVPPLDSPPTAFVPAFAPGFAATAIPASCLRDARAANAHPLLAPEVRRGELATSWTR